MIYLITYCNKTGKIMNFPTFPYACRAFSYRQCSSTPSLGSVKRPPGSSAGDGTPSVLHACTMELADYLCLHTAFASYFKRKQ